MADHNMADQDKDKQLDDLLESLLSRYSLAEPRPGLETRILATMEGHATQRQRRWLFVFAASVAAVLFAVLIANVRNVKQGIPDHMSTQKSPPESVPRTAKKGLTAPQATNNQLVHKHRETSAKSGAINVAILQMADVGHEGSSDDNPDAEPETPTLSPTPGQEIGPAIAQLTSPPNMSIRGLGVRAIEVKELNPAKDLD